MGAHWCQLLLIDVDWFWLILINQMDNLSCEEISPHDKKFSTGTACDACDKYQVWKMLLPNRGTLFFYFYCLPEPVERLTIFIPPKFVKCQNHPSQYTIRQAHLYLFGKLSLFVGATYLPQPLCADCLLSICRVFQREKDRRVQISIWPSTWREWNLFLFVYKSRQKNGKGWLLRTMCAVIICPTCHHQEAPSKTPK